MRRILIMAAVALPLSAGSSVAVAGRSGCNTRACLERTCRTAKCHERVREKQLARRPMRSTMASWYGPGLYGNALGCGGTLTPGTLGVAHKSLPCGTRVRICKAACVTVSVVDRGPYVAGREFDLTAATARAVGLVGVGTIRVRSGT